VRYWQTDSKVSEETLRGNATDPIDWRRLLKDLISYFRDIQSTYDAKLKASVKLHSNLQNISKPPGFLPAGGIGDAFDILRNHHKQAQTEISKARDIQADIVAQLSSLRSDLGQKIKEIKTLSGDFKNNVDKEKENTKKVLGAYRESLDAADKDEKPMVGKEDPYIMRLAVERQVDKQLDEENYLHRVSHLESMA
jgi:hypothetical protein